MLLLVAAGVALLALALVAQDVAFFFLGREGLTTRFVRRHTPRRRVLRVPCDRIRVTTRRTP